MMTMREEFESHADSYGYDLKRYMGFGAYADNTVQAMWSAYQAACAVTIAEFAALLPTSYYMDPPDGGDVSVLEQVRRRMQDAARWRDHIERAALATACEIACEGG